MREDRHASPTTHPLAAGSLAAGLLWFGGAGSILAVVIGNRAKREIEAAPDRYTGGDLARAAIVLGWLGIAGTVVVALLVLNFVAGFERSGGVGAPFMQEEGYRVNLQSSLRDVRSAQRRYKEEHGTFAPALEDLRLDLYAMISHEIAWADQDGFCVQGEHGKLAEEMHVTQDRGRPRAGPCPSAPS